MGYQDLLQQNTQAKGLKKKRGKNVDHRDFFVRVMAMYAAIATNEMWAVSTEGHVFEIMCGASKVIGDSHE